jgi:hypothetical protein
MVEAAGRQTRQTGPGQLPSADGRIDTAHAETECPLIFRRSMIRAAWLR